MILTFHLLTGAALASKIQIIPLSLLLAFLSHYLLDLLPHDEYLIKNIKEKKWRKSFFDFFKIGVDLLAGLVIIFILTKSKELIIYLAALFAILPDFLLFLGIIFNNKFYQYNLYLHKKSHLPFCGEKRPPFFWRFFVQLAVFIIIILLLLF